MAAPIEEKESVIELRVVTGDPEASDLEQVEQPALIEAGDQSEGSSPAPEPPSGLPNFGSEYETKGLADKDAYGELYTVFNKALNREMTVRLIPAHMLEGEEARKSFLRFCRRYVTVSHSAMVPLYSFHEDARGVWFVMEPIQGQSLESLFNQSDFKSSARVADVFEQIVESMQALHTVGIRFGAMSPCGIFIEETSHGPKVVLRDWWAYALLQAQEGKPDASTLPYASPEQLQGDGKLDERSDIYSFGAMLYEALTGAPPFHDKDPLKLAIRIIGTDAAPAIDGTFADSPFARVALNCLQKDANDRYQDVEELLKEMKAASRGAPLAKRISTAKKAAASFNGRLILAMALTSLFMMIGFANFYRSAMNDPTFSGATPGIDGTVADPFVLGQDAAPPIQNLSDEALNAESSGNYEEAKRLYGELIAQNPNDTFNLINYGRMQVQTKDYDGAFRSFEHASAIDPGLADPWYQAGLARQQLGQTKEAIRAFHKAINVDPYISAYHNELSVAYVDAGKFEKAIAAAKKAVEIEPDSFYNQFNLGVAYYAGSKTPEALTAFEAARNLSPDEAPVWTNLSLVYGKLGMHDKALNAALEATKLDPTSADNLRNLAHAHSKAGDNKRALEVYNRALQMDRFDSGTWAGLYEVYEKMGMTAEAAEAKKHFTE